MSERTFRTGVGRLVVHGPFAVGEATAIHLGLIEGPEGFRRTVAVKRPLPTRASDPATIAGLTYEACLGAQIHHPNVVSALDLVETSEGPLLVMEFVMGESLAGLLRACGRLPIPIAIAILVDILRGLDGAHTAPDCEGTPLEVVHRHVCPENVVVGLDGVARVLDLGSAVSAMDASTLPDLTRGAARDDEFTSPEQLMAWPVDGRADLFAAAVILWELVAGSQPFRARGGRAAFLRRPSRAVPPASAFNVAVTAPLEAAMERALQWSPRKRFESAAQFADELERIAVPASRAEVAAFVERVAASRLVQLHSLLDAIQAPYGRLSLPSPPRVPLLPPIYPAVRARVAEWSTIARATGTRIGSRAAEIATRWRDPIARRASTVLAALSLVCLLAAAVRASTGRARTGLSPAAAAAACAKPAR